MIPIHPANIIRLLMTTFLIDCEKNNETPINNREMELYDIIKGMLIKSQEDTSFSMEADVTLEFLEPFRPHSVEFVDDIYVPTREELLETIEFEEEQCICGFNLELHSGRTSAEQGTKSVTAVVQSISATTHSYTILPTISASGKLLSPLFIVLQEKDGNFGPRVQQSFFRPWNVYIQASTSGKLTSELVIEWLTNVYLPHAGSRSVSLLNSWTGHYLSTLRNGIPANQHVEIFTIPKKTTGMIQPPDVYGFRIWKNFVRKFSDLVLLFNYDVQLNARNNVIKLQSLIHNQLSSPKYHGVFAYANQIGLKIQ